VLIPEENVKDLQEIPENAKNHLDIVPVRWIDQVLEVALERVPQALPEEEPAKEVQKPADGTPVPASDVLPH
jgi:ATP-dependent Lon protease